MFQCMVTRADCTEFNGLLLESRHVSHVLGNENVSRSRPVALRNLSTSRRSSLSLLQIVRSVNLIGSPFAVIHPSLGGYVSCCAPRIAAEESLSVSRGPMPLFSVGVMRRSCIFRIDPRSDAGAGSIPFGAVCGCGITACEKQGMLRSDPAE
eukprot:5948369-Pleurochrysis_carterae.AAC.2